MIKLRRVFEKRRKVRCATLLCYLGKIRRVVAALAKKGVAVDAIILVPDVFTTNDGWRELVFIGEFGKGAVAVIVMPISAVAVRNGK